MTRAVVLGGTGAIGGAVALRLAEAGWSVDVTGRDPGAMPAALAAAGVRFHAVDRADASAVDRLVGDDTDLLLDLLAFRAADVRALLPAMSRSNMFRIVLLVIHPYSSRCASTRGRAESARVRCLTAVSF